MQKLRRAKPLYFSFWLFYQLLQKQKIIWIFESNRTFFNFKTNFFILLRSSIINIIAMNILFSFLILSLIFSAHSRWTSQKAWQWYQQYKWAAGVNYIPAYAVNQIQMWTNLNLDAIDQELRWATNIGFSKFRTFLHIQPYIDNPTEFIKNIFKFLSVAKNRKADIIFVLYDDCWNPIFQSGKQPQPKPGIHNSQWVQCPGNIKIAQEIHKNYVQDIISSFKTNQNIAMWDLYNEVGNSGHLTNSLPLLKNIFSWARQINPIQPLTSGRWNTGQQFKTINQFILNQSDVITFHAYCDQKCTLQNINEMKKYQRPTICTQYMARPLNSKFITHLPIFKGQKVWAINWGFVFGRTQTYFPWWSKQGDPVPDIWFHDVVHPDGTPFDQKQTNFIRNITN